MKGNDCAQKPITEDMHLEKEWFEQAEKQTLETLPQFISHIMNDYIHDYGTVCHAISACAIAAAWAASNEPGSCGGITGFQAGFVMWDFIKQWLKTDNKCGLRLIDYDSMLYPQYGYKFEKTITPETWERLKLQAIKNLEDIEYAHQDVIAHWQSIADGNIPFGYIVKED